MSNIGTELEAHTNSQLPLSQQTFTIPADLIFGFERQTYTGEEIMEFVGGVESQYTTKLLRDFAETMAANIEGDNSFDFNDSEDDMLEDFQSQLITK